VPSAHEADRPFDQCQRGPVAGAAGRAHQVVETLEKGACRTVPAAPPGGGLVLPEQGANTAGQCGKRSSTLGTGHGEVRIMLLRGPAKHRYCFCLVAPVVAAAPEN